MLVRQYPYRTVEGETAQTGLGPREDMTQVRARNALRILLDVHGDFGRR